MFLSFSRHILPKEDVARTATRLPFTRRRAAASKRRRERRFDRRAIVGFGRVDVLHSNRRVLILYDRAERCEELRAVLEGEGYATFGADDVYALVQTFDEAFPTLILHDVSEPRSWCEVARRERLLRSLIRNKCPILPYGIRPPTSFASWQWSCQSASHVPTHDGYEPLLTLVRQLLWIESEKQHLDPHRHKSAVTS